MSAALLGAAVLAAQILLVAAIACAVFRAMRGPRAQDRVLAVDALWAYGAMLLLVFGIRTGSRDYFEAALLITLLGAILGGTLGTRYHRKIDRAGLTV